jgi:hypothetical protein
MSTANQNESNHESNSAASTIQRCYRRRQHSATRVSSLTLVYGDFGISEKEDRDKYDSHDLVTPEATELGFPMSYKLQESDMADVTKTTKHQDDEHEDEDSKEHPGEDRGEEKERKRSHSRGFAAITKPDYSVTVDAFGLLEAVHGEVTGGGTGAGGGAAGGGAAGGGAGGGAIVHGKGAGTKSSITTRDFSVTAVDAFDLLEAVHGEVTGGGASGGTGGGAGGGDSNVMYNNRFSDSSFKPNDTSRHISLLEQATKSPQ